MSYWNSPNRYVLVQLRKLYERGQLSVNDQRLMGIYEQLVRGQRRKDAARVLQAVAVLLASKGVTEQHLAQAEASERSRIGRPAEPPRGPVAQPTDARKTMLATLQSAHTMLQPEEQETIEQYVGVLGGQLRLPPERFRQLEAAVQAIYQAVQRVINEDAASVLEAVQDDYTALDYGQKLRALEHGLALVLDEDDVGFVQGLVMQEQMGLLELTPAAKKRIDVLYATLLQHSTAGQL